MELDATLSLPADVAAMVVASAVEVSDGSMESGAADQPEQNAASGDLPDAVRLDSVARRGRA
jgi:hypothetical protein